MWVFQRHQAVSRTSCLHTQAARLWEYFLSGFHWKEPFIKKQYPVKTGWLFAHQRKAETEKDSRDEN